jgi:hypothetical protein
MNDPKSPKPKLQPVIPGASRPNPSTTPPKAEPSGRVRHDDRGNAVWEFIATTSRICLDATSRLLKKLETPELKMEDAKDEELRIMPEPSTGGGYDPYNQATKPPPKKPTRK